MKGIVDWSSLQAFLVLAREERLTAAARRAGIDHATLKRRITSLEEQLGATLFERTPWGYVLTSSGRAVLGVVEEMESVSFKLASDGIGSKRAIEGMFRIAAPDVFGQGFLAEHLGALIDLHPCLEVELVTTPRAVDLSKREADLAITGQRPEHGRLHSLKLTDYELGLYATQAYLDRSPPIRDLSDLGEQRLIGYIDEFMLQPDMNCFAAIDPSLKPTIRSTTSLSQIKTVLADAGVAILPCWVASRDSRLIRLLPDEVSIWRSYWLAYNSDMREVASVRAVCDFILETVTAARARFAPSRHVREPVVDLMTARVATKRSQ